MVVHLDDDFFPQLEKAIKPYQDYEQVRQINGMVTNIKQKIIKIEVQSYAGQTMMKSMQ